ncbi:unnamed protein product [Rhizophagus irregularis]|nr:unnamed protein product [Rhizophagus irregularis]
MRSITDNIKYLIVLRHDIYILCNDEELEKVEEVEEMEEVKDEEVEDEEVKDEEAEGAEEEEIEVTEGDVDSDKVHKLKKKGISEKERSFIWLHFEKFTDDKNIT